MEIKNRFSGAIWAKETKKYSAQIVGLGATGSYLSLFLGRAGINRMRLIDPDQYELHNVGSQLADWESVGKNKVQVTLENLTKFTTAGHIRTSTDLVEDVAFYVEDFEIICSTLDSMSGRQFIFDRFNSSRSINSLLLDSRISAEYWEVYAVPSNNLEKIERYKETLFSDEQGNVGACNYQQSSHSACGAAIKMTELVTNFITNNIIQEDILPFKITLDIRTQNYESYY